MKNLLLIIFCLASIILIYVFESTNAIYSPLAATSENSASVEEIASYIRMNENVKATTVAANFDTPALIIFAITSNLFFISMDFKLPDKRLFKKTGSETDLNRLSKVF